MYIEKPRRCGFDYFRGFDHKFPDGGKYPAFPDGKLYLAFEEDKNHKALFCPMCKNHTIDWNDVLCNICKTPLYNHCLEEGKKLSLECRRCPSCGGLTTYSEIYNEMGDCIIPRPARFKKYDRLERWGYVRYLLKRKSMYLYAILSDSVVYTDMNCFVLVFAGDERHRQGLFSNLSVISKFIETYAFVHVKEFLLYHFNKSECQIYWIAPNDKC
jgi:hypothetical protein